MGFLGLNPHAGIFLHLLSKIHKNGPKYIKLSRKAKETSNVSYNNTICKK
jgi:hypothetical protein